MNPIDERRWLEMVDALDTHMSTAIEFDIAQRGLTPSDIARGYSELGKLRHIEEPDYNARGVAVAYGFNYFAQRALSVALAVSQFDDLPNPLRVLDIGSGTGAATAGLRLALPGWSIHVIAVEPAAEMREQSAVYTSGFAAIHEPHEGKLEEILDRSLLPTSEAFDLIILSAALGYGFGRAFTKHHLIERGLMLVRRLAPHGRILLVEPAAKRYEWAGLAKGLARAGLRTLVAPSGKLAPFPLQRPMPRMTELMERLRPKIEDSGRLSDVGSELLGPPWPIESWAKSPDYYLFADSGFRSPPPLLQALSPNARRRISQLWLRRQRAQPDRPALQLRVSLGQSVLFGLSLTAGVAALTALVVWLS